MCLRKRAYPDEAAAKGAVAALRGRRRFKGIGYFRCPLCRLYHLGRKKNSRR